MKISRIIATLCVVTLGVLLTTKAYGNVYIPSLTVIAGFSVKILLPILVGIIAIEAIVLKMYLPTITWLHAFKATTLSNCVSTIVGIPFAVMVAIVSQRIPFIMNLGDKALHENGTLSEQMLFVLLWLIPCFLLSAIIETWINKRVLPSIVPPHQLKTATWLANLASYAFLYIVVLTKLLPYKVF
jgi:hypothetical protein